MKLLKLLNNKGFTLIEAAIGVGMITVGMLTYLQISDSSITSRKMSMAAEQYSAVMNRVQAVMSSPTFCRLALGGPDAVGGTPPSIAQIMNTNGGTNIKIYEPQTGAGRPVYLEPATVVNNWRAVSLVLTPLNPPADPNTTEFVSLSITLENITGEQDINMYDIRFNVALDASRKIVNCSNLKYSANDTPVPTCADPNFALKTVGTRTQCLRVKCQSPTPTHNGVNATTGEPICIP
jgi:hypothetical protein